MNSVFIRERSLGKKLKCYINSEALVRGCSVEKVFLEISQNFTGKHLCQSLFLNKVAGLRPENTFTYRTPPVATSIN